MSRRLGLMLLGAAVLALAGCSSSDRAKPAALEPVSAKIAGRQVWSARIGKIDFPLVVASRGDAFHVAAGDGTVAAFDAADGRERWRTSVGARLSAGVGTDGRFTAVVTRDNEVVVLDNGKPTWRQSVPAPVATPPLVAGERVFVLAVDRSIHAFDALDGRRLWVLNRPGEALTLAQPGVLAVWRDTLLAGSGPRLIAVDPLRGVVRWEAAVANPRGTNEVERLADLVGPAQREGDVFCMRAYQTAIGCVDAARAATAWTQPVGGVQAVAGDPQYVFAADGAGRFSARRRAGGDLVWTHERLAYRDLSGPVVAGTTVAVGDLDGQVHFMSRETGETLLRLPTDGSAVVGPLVLSGTTLLAVTRDGGLFALRPQ
jgi:outer membrane protein assembly factor BamB